MALTIQLRPNPPGVDPMTTEAMDHRTKLAGLKFCRAEKTKQIACKGNKLACIMLSPGGGYETWDHICKAELLPELKRQRKLPIRETNGMYDVEPGRGSALRVGSGVDLSESR